MTQHVEKSIREFLLLTGAEKFWIDSAMGYIMRGLTTNTAFPVAIVGQDAQVNRGMVSRYRADVRVSIPDTLKRRTVKLSYTFKPEREKAHSVRVTAPA